MSFNQLSKVYYTLLEFNGSLLTPKSFLAYIIRNEYVQYSMSDENSIDMAEVDDLTIANINNLESSPSK